MSYPLVSVIIPCYNNVTTVTKSIQSVLDQKYPNIEIIVINDGSTDNLLDVLNDSYLLETGIQLFSNQNRGVSYSRNFGIQKAKGDFVLFLDADDSLDDDFVVKLVKDVVCTDILYGSTIKKIYTDYQILEILNEDYDVSSFIRGLLEGEIAGFSFRYIFPKKKLNQNSFSSDISYMEDYLFLLQYIVENDIKRIRFNNDTHYNYTQTETSVTNNTDSEQINKNIHSMIKVLESTKTKEAAIRYEIPNSVICRRKARLLEYSFSKISDYRTWRAVLHNDINRKYLNELVTEQELSLFLKLILYYYLNSNYFGFKCYQLARKALKMIVRGR